MKKVEVEVSDIALSGSSSGAYAMVLSEVSGNRKLPIVIGGSEAQAIAIEIEKMKASRPLTHDLFKSAFGAFGIRVLEVVIYNMVEGVFFAKMLCVSDDQTEEVDCRPSDAVAIAYRFGCPIYCAESVMKMAGIGPEEMERVEQAEAAAEAASEEPAKARSIKDLKKELKQA
ncbi:MAG: bifunctional nuclease family protein, partial [Flavobacteriales bacterium]